jgi:16S rRNA processing protein RimM
VTDVAAAEKLRGRFIEIPHRQLKSLPEGQHYHFQLIGLQVWSTKGEFLGEITDILTTAGNDSYVVKGDNEELLIPAIEDVVKSIDIAGGLVVIEPIEGLLELNRRIAT